MSSNYWDLQQLAAQLADLATSQAAQIQDLQRQINDLTATVTDQAAGSPAIDASALQSQIDDLRTTQASDPSALADLQSQVDDLRATLAQQSAIAPTISAAEPLAGLPGLIPIGTGAGVDWQPIAVPRLSAFPDVPYTGQLVFRTDLNLLCTYYGTYWGAAYPHWVMPEELAGIVACWHFGHRNAATVYDMTKRARDLTAIGAPGYANFAQRGAYATLNGSSQYFANTSTDFGAFAAGSACLWVLANSFASAPVFIGNDATPAHGWALGSIATGEMYVDVDGTRDNSGRYPLHVSEWHLIWFTYDGSSAYGYAFGDGGEKSIGQLSGAIGPQASAFKIGMMNGAYLNGRVAAPKFFSAAVPQSLREYVFLCERPIIG